MKRQRVPPVTWIVAAVMVLILIVILKSLVPEVRGPTRRTIDASNLRQIGQAALIYSVENNDRLPETDLGPDGIPAEDKATTIHRYAVALAREAGLNETGVFISPSDRHPGVRHDQRNQRIVRTKPGDEGISVNSAFLESGISYQLIGGLTMDLPSATPIAFTRGLREDGTWDPENGVHGSQGGHMIFLAGNVRWSGDLQSEFGRLESLTGEPTSNILETLTGDHAVYGDPEPPIAEGTRGVETIAESPAE